MLNKQQFSLPVMISVSIMNLLVSSSIQAAENKQVNPKDKVELVTMGKALFNNKGCSECHSIKLNDPSFKTGPNLYGLFQTPIKKHSIVRVDGVRPKIKADAKYLKKSILQPAIDLAIQSKGPEKGKAYLPIMPKFKLSGQQIDALYAYLHTVNPKSKSGPAQVWANLKPSEEQNEFSYDNELWVGKQAVISRSLLPGVSTRTIHVGLPNKVNYSFDTVDMSIKQVWWGDFLDITNEKTDRGRGLNKRAANSQDWQIASLLTPLTSNNDPVDLSFKNWPTFKQIIDLERYRLKIEKQKANTPYLDQIKQAKSKYLGVDYTNKELPALSYDIDGVIYQQKVSIDNNGVVGYHFSLENVNHDIKFKINQTDNTIVEVSHGKIKNNIWHIDANDTKAFSIGIKPNTLPAPSTSLAQLPAYSHDKQPVVTTLDLDAKLPAGYKAESIMAPKDRFGRAQLFEPLGLDFAKNGTAVIASRTAGVWKIKDNQWHFFAEGFLEPLGVHIEDEHANSIVIAQKPEITRIVDIDNDGYADLMTNINDDWRFAGNYSEYVHGPVADKQGNFYLNLNLGHGGNREKGSQMGTYGGYDGWLIQINKAGKFIPFASGLRSPAGLGYGPNDMLLYTDNQGAFVGTSKMHIVEQNAYFGYPSSLKFDDDKYRGKPFSWQEANKTAKLAEIYFPHNIVANSPGNPSFDSTNGQFGPFSGQILVGDQALSNISRVTLEQVNGQWQGAVMPFIDNLKSGAMRLTFAPDNSLWIGQTGRGWQAKGGDYEALQRISWDGNTMPFEILDVKLKKGGFNVNFTDVFNQQNINKANIEISSWRYIDTNIYGSPRHDLLTHNISNVSIESDKSILINIEQMRAGYIYEVKFSNLSSKSGLTANNSAAYYTLHKLK